MAGWPLPEHEDNATASVIDSVSDYGSDLDEDTAFAILSQAESQSINPAVLETIEEAPLPAEHEPPEQRMHLRLSGRVHQPVDNVRESESQIESILGRRRIPEATVEVEYDEGNRTSFSPVRENSQTEQQPPPEQPQAADTRSPLERFRTPPKKPLSVTDLVSPAWCEQQYEYSLTKYGRVRATPAMRQGSKVHKKLEEQVHQVVPVQTVSKEDRFGLRIWNTIEGLRGLQEDGLTRELEVWGIIEDELVIGIIDEVGTVCPDEKMEQEISADMRTASAHGKAGGKKKSERLPPDQRTLTDFLTSSQGGSVLEDNAAFLGKLQEEKPRTFYIKDVKTRQSRTLPALGAPSRPTHIQLMLYHRLLSSLAANEVAADKVFERYALDPHAHFSDKFIAEIANLNVNVAPPSQQEEDTSPFSSQRQDPLTELLAHNTLTSLWSLMMAEFSRTFAVSCGQGPHKIISPLLTAEFRTAAPRVGRGEELFEEAGALIGQRCFAFDEAIINRYIRSEMAWWKGERPTVGVDVEEASKCRMCDFRDSCTWLATKVEEGLKKVKLRQEGRKNSQV